MCGIPLSSVLGPFPLTRQLNSYCMVLVEGHCRWAEMVAIPGKESAIIARVFLVSAKIRQVFVTAWRFFQTPVTTLPPNFSSLEV